MTALNAGVRSIEHGFMFDCEISALMKEKGAYITTNLTAFDPGLLDIPAVRDVPASLAKAKSASARKSYHYRVVMVKGDGTQLDMRGRCSAGQKVRLARHSQLLATFTCTSTCSVHDVCAGVTDLCLLGRCWRR